MVLNSLSISVLDHVLGFHFFVCLNDYYYVDGIVSTNEKENETR